MLRRRLSRPQACLLALVLATGAAGALAQTRMLLPPQPVAVEFRALGDEGAPILDLSTSEVVLKVDGKVRVLQSLDLIQSGTGGPDRAEDSGLPEPYATNAVLPERRDLYLVLEDDSIAPGTEKRVRAAVDRLLEGLSRRDRVGLLNIPRGGINIGLTADRQQIRQAVSELVGLGTRGQTTDDARCRTIITLQALKDVFLAVRGQPSTTVVFFSSGLAPPDTSAAVLGQSTDLCPVKVDYYNELRDSAALSGVSFYAVHVFNDTAIPQASSTSDLTAGLEHLAGAANGDIVRLMTQDASGIARLVRETSAFYRAVFDPEPAERDDRLHRVDLVVTRRGVAVRTESAIAIAKALTRGSSNEPPSVTDLLRTTGVRRDVQLRVAAYPSQGGSGNTVKVVVVFEPVGTVETLRAAAVGLYDAQGRLTSQVTLRRDELAHHPAFTAITAKPGSYRLRVAAADGNGRIGTVDTSIEAALTRADPLTLSSMVLGTAEDGRFQPRLQFVHEPLLMAYLEAYGVPNAADIAAVFELATVRDGPAVGSVPGRIQRGDGGAWQISAGIGLTQVPPGDYLLRAIVTIDGRPLEPVARTLRKVR